LEEQSHLTSGADADNHLAQRGPDEASERPRRGGGTPVRGPCPEGARQGRDSAPPLLDNMVISARTDVDQSPDSRKRRRAYHRLRTGLSFHSGQRLRFLTLTLVEGSPNDIHECFRIFKERVRRLTPNRIRKLDTEEYFTPQRMSKFFDKEKDWDKKLKFAYFSVIIRDARQHMHILYFGNWLPHAWLKKVWKEITGDSDVVDIRTTRNPVDDERRLASYTLGQYVLFQDGEIRFQMSQDWTWRGMVRDWKKTVKKFTRQVRGKYIVSFGELLVYWADFVKDKKTTQMPLI